MSETVNEPQGMTLYEIIVSVQKFAIKCQDFSVYMKPKIEGLQKGVQRLQKFIGAPTPDRHDFVEVDAIEQPSRHSKNIADSIALTDSAVAQHTVVQMRPRSLVEFIITGKEGVLRVHEKTITFEGKRRLDVLQLFHDNRGNGYKTYANPDVKYLMEKYDWDAEGLRHIIRDINKRVAKEVGKEDFQIIQTKKASNLSNSPTMFRWIV